MSNEKKINILYAGIALVFAMAVLLGWASFRPRALESVKDLTVTIHHADGAETSFPVTTTARYLLEALEPCDFIEAGNTDYGARVTAADGEFADPAEGVFWVFTVNGASPDGRADAHPIEDGDVYDFYILTY